MRLSGEFPVVTFAQGASGLGCLAPRTLIGAPEPKHSRAEALVAVYEMAFEEDGPPAEETVAIGKGEAYQPLALGTTKSIGLRVGHSSQEYIIEAMDLTALYTHGTKLAEVSPEFRGMPLNEWLHKWELQQATVQAAEYDRRFRDSMPAGYEHPLSRKAVSTPRDDYGMKGVRGNSRVPGRHETEGVQKP